MNWKMPDSNHFLYCLTSDEVSLSHSEQVQFMCRSGVKLIQLRSKVLPRDQLLDEAKKSVEICKSFGATFIVNDCIEVAKRSGASGVHLGIKDVCPVRACELLEDDQLIGETVHSLREAEEVKERGICSYVGLGPYRKSFTKKALKPQLSTDEFSEIIKTLQPIPVYLIGGLVLEDFDLLDPLGLAGICVCSGLSEGEQFGVHLPAFVKGAEKLKFAEV